MDRYALVVGIAQYSTKGLVPLEKTTTDAEAVAQVLEQYGNFTEVKRLPYRINPETKKREMENRPVTKKQLWQAIKTLLKEQARNNDALIYFTGHGLRAEGLSGKPRGYLATSDCQIDFDVIKSEGNKDESRIMEVYGGIPFDDLNDLISESELSSLVVLLDCCHSGDFIERNLITHSLGISLEKDYHLIAACRGFQEGKALKSEAHSVFTGALLRGLRAENASSNGEISCDRLYDYISRELKGASQQPLRLGWGTSIILVNNLPIAPAVVKFPAVQAVVNRDNPYLGLMAFDADKKDYFFGRESAARGIVERLSKSRFLAVIGPSGCGKSSLVKAGVLPKLKRDLIPNSSQWEVKIFTPGRYPLEELEQALANREPDKTFLLFIDQFEELFTLVSDESQQREFISKITKEATKIDGDTRVIVAIRGDFLDRCAGYEETANLINCTQPTTYLVTPMTTAELTEAIQQPAEKHAITFESGLVEQIIIDVVNQAGALPLLQYALAELWRVCITDSNHSQPQLTFNGYEQIRGVKGALEKRADELYQNLAEADQKFVRCLFLELVQLGENQEVTRRHASWQDLLDKADSQEQLERVTRQLANWNQRLIITDENKVEVAHEALLSEWRLLREWIEDNRDNIRLERRLEGDCQEWNKQNRLEGLLLAGTWLAAIDEWVNGEQPRLSPLESEFLRESFGRRDRQIQQQINRLEKEIKLTDEKLKAQKQKTRLAIITGIFAAFTLGFGIVAQLRQRQIVEQEAMTVGTLISTPQTLFNNQDQLGAMIAGIKAISALEKLKGKDAVVPDELKSVIAKVREYNRLEHSQPLTVVNFSPNGQTIATGSMDGSINIWTAEGKIWQSLSKTLGHKQVVWSIDYSHDGAIASAGRDKVVKIWDASGKFIKNLTGHTDAVYDVNWSPVKNRVVSCSKDGTVRLWDVTRGKEIDSLTNQGRLLRLDFSPDGSKVTFVGNDNKVNIWNIEPNKNEPRVITIGKHDNRGQYKGEVSFVKFNGNGTILASSDYDGNIVLWNVKTKEKIITIKSGSGIQGLAFSRKEDNIIAAALVDGTVRLWNLEGTTVDNLKGHHDEVMSLSFNPASTSEIIIASASEDKTVKLWKIDESQYFDYTAKNMLEYSCDFLENYFQTHEKLSSEGQESRTICQKIRSE